MPQWFYAAGSGLLTVALLIPIAFRGWIPHDEGTLGQAATRVLDGQWPHIDFLDVYPGLQGFLHAGVFTLFGESIASLRIAWLGIAVLAAISTYFLLNKKMRGGLAAFGAVGLVTLAFVIYPASMPTWWNLSLGLFTLSLVYAGWLQGRGGLVLGGGLITGASILIKTTGGVFIAMAVFLWLLWASENRPRWYGYLFTGTAIALVVVLVVPVISIGRVVLLGLPAMAAVVFPLYLAEEDEADNLIEGATRAGFPWLFGAGTLFIPAIAVGAYLSIGRLDALFDGWVSSPALRFNSAEGDIPFAPEVLLLLVLIISALVLATRLGTPSAVMTVGLVGSLSAWAILEWGHFGPYFFAVVSFSPLLIALGFIGWRGRLHLNRLAVLVTTSALLFALVQIPLWNGFYAAYTIPLLGLSFLFLLPRGHVLAVSLLAVTAGVFLIQSNMGRLVGPLALDESVPFVELTTPRAGISVPVFDGYYDELIVQISEVAGDRPIYAGPDAPEVAFLAGVDSATAAFFEVLDPHWDYYIVADLAATGSAVAVNTSPGFSDPIPREILSEVKSVNQMQSEVGKFILTWSDSHE